MTLKSIYDIELNSAEGDSGFLNQYKGKVTMVVNTTVGCGNANQMEVLQMLQDKYQSQGFEIIAIPTNDYCGPGITKGKWSEGITCGADSQAYGKDVYGTTFGFSEMVGSIPHDKVSETPGINGLGKENLPPHELYLTIRDHQRTLKEKNKIENTPTESQDYYSHWLNLGFDNGDWMGGNFEKYLVDKDGYVAKHYQCTTLNYDIEATLKANQPTAGMGLGRSQKIFEEEFAVVCQHIEELLAGAKAAINPSVEAELQKLSSSQSISLA
jgi:glutathione peroxidase-family protein